ncbi:MAG: hypothetical protein MUP28_07210 [Candidatus Aminicenantes bacterium]|nr:hypothetical protein [Candidatus Aminicenantes bacterium]
MSTIQSPPLPFLSPGAHEPLRRTAGKTLAVGVFAVLVLVRLPFFLTSTVQEDSYISWRCARNLVEHGVYGFNPAERVSASTTHLYVLLSAATMVIAGDHFVPLLIALNTALFLLGLLLLCRLLEPDPRRGLLLWLISGMLPVAFDMTTLGMETSLLFFLLSVLVWTVHSSRWPLAAVVLCLLPWVRPDSAVFSVIILLYAWWRTRCLPWKLALALTMGYLAVGLFNYFYFGQLINQTIVAKSVCYHPLRTFGAMAERLKVVFIGDAIHTGIFGLLSTKYLTWLNGPIAVIVTATLFVFLAKPHPRGVIGPWLLGLAIVPPAFYAAAGAMFPWYFAPSVEIGLLLLCATILYGLTRCPLKLARALTVALVFIILTVSAGKWYLTATDFGPRFLTGIGKYIAGVAKSRDTLLLEPAGFIPFYARIFTFDEVGLVSPQVTTYMRRFGVEGWWLPFLHDFHPTFVLERRPFRTEGRLSRDTALTPEQLGEFFADYELVKSFECSPGDYFKSPFMLKLAGLRTCIPFDLYQRRVSKERD